MKKIIPQEQLLFNIFLYTICAVRIFLFLFPTPGPTIADLRIHHYIFGIIFLIISIIIKKARLFAIGLALFVDELTFLITNGTTHQDNYSFVSIAGTIFFILLVYIFKTTIFYKITKHLSLN